MCAPAVDIRRRAGAAKGRETRLQGVVGQDLTLQDGQDAARVCVLNILGSSNTLCDGDFDPVARIVRLAGLVRCADAFEDQTRVLNAATDLICHAFGEKGKHARIASGTNALPSGMAVEIEAVAGLAH
jgi:enamine deaminase RidA (YjgF/YER057c/UK114 family)